jgi:hypothetical protein
MEKLREAYPGIQATSDSSTVRREARRKKVEGHGFLPIVSLT